jgi:hypothetical protein
MTMDARFTETNPISPRGCGGTRIADSAEESLARRGAIAHATVRRPGPKLTPETLAELDRMMMRLGANLGV